MPRPGSRDGTWMIAAAAVTLAVSVGCVLFVSNYLNYTGESVTLGSLLRIAAGKPYVGRLDSIPIQYNPYSPYLAWLLTPAIRLFRLSAPEPIAFAGRLVVLAFFGLYAGAIRRFLRTWFPREWNARTFALALCWVMLLFPANLFAVRPDLLSFLAEFASFAAMFRYLHAPVARYRVVVLAGLLAGLAIAMKTNTVGGMAGLLVVLLMERRLAAAGSFVAMAALVVAAHLGLLYLTLGPTAIDHLWYMLGNASFSGVSLARRALEVMDQPFVDNLLFGVFVVHGLLTIRAQDPRKARMLAAFLAGSLVFATIGQAKIGASTNYYIGAFMMATIPLSFGLAGILAPVAEDFTRTSLRVALYVLWPILILRAAQLPVGIVLNDARHFPYEAVKARIARDYPQAIIYTPDESAAVHFADRTVLGPWTEAFLTTSAGFRSQLPGIRQELTKRKFTLAITTGSGCAAWRPNGLFAAETDHLRTLAAQYDKICLFSSP